MTAPGTPRHNQRVEQVEVVVAHHERATLRVGDTFLKIDGDRKSADIEVAAMALAPVPTPQILWRTPPVLALASVAGSALGRLGASSTAAPAAWAAAGAAVRKLHDAPLPPWGGRSAQELAAELDRECGWILAHDVLPADVMAVNRRIAESVIRPWRPAFIHGDLQAEHVFVLDDEVTGILDWSEAARGDALYDLAVLTIGHPEHLDDVLAGYGGDVDVELIHAWWSVRGLLGIRWLVEHGYNPNAPGAEGDVLRARM